MLITCIFCGERGQRSREHAWSNWIGEELKRRSGLRGRVQVITIGDSGMHSQEMVAFTKRLANVCKPCNTGWMRDIEEDARPILVPMIFDGAEVALDASTQTKIAAWAYLRWFILQAVATPRVSPSFVPTHYYREMAKHHRPPATARIWLGSFETTEIATSVFNFANLDSFPPGIVLREVTKEAYHSTLHISRLVMRVFLYAATPQTSSQLGLTINPPFDVFLYMIWPPNLDTRTWPGQVLDQQRYGGLIRTVPVASLERQRINAAR